MPDDSTTADRESTTRDLNMGHDKAVEMIPLLSSEGRILFAYKERLIRESTFFRDLFTLPLPITLADNGKLAYLDPIPIDISFHAVSVLHGALSTDYTQVRSQGTWVPSSVIELPLQDQVLLRDATDRFDCERIHRYITSTLKESITLSPSKHLSRASDANNIEQARLAIAELGNCPNWHPTGLYRGTWWAAIADLQPTWQLELTKLFWKEGFQLIDREADEARPRHPNDRAYPRIREVVMQQTRRTYAQIAADFNP